MATANSQFEVVGANPFLLDGPSTAGVSPSSGAGQIFPAATVGSVSAGSAGSEFVYCKLVLDGSTVLVPGTAYVIDKQYTATPLTTTNSPRGSNVAWGLVNAPTAPAAGTYYIWLQRAGNLGVRSNGTVNQAGLCETSATAGVCGFPASATVGSKLVVGTYIYATSLTFTANTVNGSNVITVAAMTAGSDLSDLCVGATIAGTGIPGSSFIGGVSNVGGTVKLTITTSDLKTASNATATGSAVTMTQAGTLVANAAWPYIDKTN